MSKSTIVPSTGDYFITAFLDGEAIVNRILAYKVSKHGTSAITAGGGIEDCDHCYFDGFHTGIIDHEGKVASGGNVFKSVASFIAFVKKYFNPDLVADTVNREHCEASFEVADSKHLH